MPTTFTAKLLFNVAILWLHHKTEKLPGGGKISWIMSQKTHFTRIALLYQERMATKFDEGLLTRGFHDPQLRLCHDMS